jgi:glycosyltransferase involved in cell wall biosynthesis
VVTQNSLPEHITLEHITSEHIASEQTALENTTVIDPIPPLSVIICTYNRADRLLLALEALTKQTISSKEFEVLVVDNRSTDNTSAICKSFQARFANFRYIYEPTQGLSKARNTGWQTTQSSYIAYLDDDAIPSEQWIEAILTVFETVQPTPASIGGPIYPLWEIPRPEWITPIMETLFTMLDGGDTPRWFNEDEYPWGANVIYRRDALEEAGGFCEQLGRKGQSLLSGEETLLNATLKSKGEKFYYSPQASVLHWVPKQRINPTWLVQRSYWQGYSVALVDSIVGKSPLYQRLSSTWNLLKRLLDLSPLILQLFGIQQRVQIGLLDQAKLLLSWQWGYFSKVWFD